MNNLINLPAINDLHLDFSELDFPTQYMWADNQYELIKKYIIEFEDSLDKDHEVGVMLTNFGQSILMQVEEIGYEKSVMLVFKGKINGKNATFIQHINQLNFLLTSVDRENSEKPKRRIGFVNNDI